MTMNPYSDRPLYKQLADLIRIHIECGELAAGQRLPAEVEYAQQHDISRDSVRRGMALLRAEGLIITDRRGSRVRGRRVRTTVTVDQGTITARMPSDSERRTLRIDEGVPVLIISRPDQREELHSADCTQIAAGGAGGATGARSSPANALS